MEWDEMFVCAIHGWFNAVGMNYRINSNSLFILHKMQQRKSSPLFTPNNVQLHLNKYFLSIINKMICTWFACIADFNISPPPFLSHSSTSHLCCLCGVCAAWNVLQSVKFDVIITLNFIELNISFIFLFLFCESFYNLSLLHQSQSSYFWFKSFCEHEHFI